MEVLVNTMQKADKGDSGCLKSPPLKSYFHIGVHQGFPKYSGYFSQLFTIFTTAAFSLITKLLVRAATVICRSGVDANADEAQQCSAMHRSEL